MFHSCKLGIRIGAECVGKIRCSDVGCFISCISVFATCNQCWLQYLFFSLCVKPDVDICYADSLFSIVSSRFNWALAFLQVGCVCVALFSVVSKFWVFITRNTEVWCIWIIVLSLSTWMNLMCSGIPCNLLKAVLVGVWLERMFVVVQLHEIASYCLVKVLFFFQLPFTCQSFYCGNSDLSGYHVSLVGSCGYCGQMPD